MDWAEEICKQHLMQANGWSAIDSSNYGTRYVALAKEIGNMLNKLSEVIDLGINVVVTAHAWLRKKEEPDEMGAYDRYELKLEKKTAPLVKEWADMVLFANYKTTILTDEKTNSKKATGGQRVMYTTHKPTWDAKNRLGLADELPFEYVQIADAFNKATTSVVSVETDSGIQSINDLPETNLQPIEPPQTDIPELNEPDISDQIPANMADLMKLNKVTPEEIMQIIYQGGFMTADTPIENIPNDLWGYLVTNWDKAMGLLNNQIRK
jgi:hypothetical protein